MPEYNSYGEEDFSIKVNSSSSGTKKKEKFNIDDLVKDAEKLEQEEYRKNKRKQIIIFFIFSFTGASLIYIFFLLYENMNTAGITAFVPNNKKEKPIEIKEGEKAYYSMYLIKIKNSDILNDMEFTKVLNYSNKQNMVQTVNDYYIFPIGYNKEKAEEIKNSLIQEKIVKNVLLISPLLTLSEENINNLNKKGGE